MRHSAKRLTWLISPVLLLSACGERSAVGFRLPDNGDAGRGEKAFVALECHRCHSVSGAQLPAPDGTYPIVHLGGTVREVRTDGYLVTSIIHPSHKIGVYPVEGVVVEGESRMPDYSRGMTVRQLIDIVAFLRSHYQYQSPR